MDFAVPAETQAICRQLEQFMEEWIYPLERSRERWVLQEGGPAYPPAIRALQQKAKELGYWAFHLPKEAGGAGLPFMQYVFVNEILGRSPIAPVVCGSQAPDSGNAEILWRFGTEEQKERWLRPLVDGEIRSCFSMTEPEVAGSDPRLLRTTAVREGDYYVINGHKWFTSGAHGAAFAIVMALTNPEREGIQVVDSTLFVPELLAPEGVLTARAPSSAEMEDLRYGLEIAREIARLDLGQTIAVKDRAVVAIEAMEGTDATIRRAASLLRGRPFVVVKVARPHQDMRFDVPVIGAPTIQTMIECRATALAITARKTLLMDRTELLALANRHGIAVLAVP